MKTSLLWKRLLIGCLLFALLTGCATAAPETPIQPTATLTDMPTATPIPPTDTPEPTATSIPPTDTPEPTSCKDVEGNCLELSFDGENCTYEGPTNLETGPVTLLFHNESGGEALVGLVSHIGNASIQDMIDHIGEGPLEGNRPYWARQVRIEGVPAGESDTWEEVLEAEIYSLLCGISDPHLLWFGAGLTVDD